VALPLGLFFGVWLGRSGTILEMAWSFTMLAIAALALLGLLWVRRRSMGRPDSGSLAPRWRPSEAVPAGASAQAAGGEGPPVRSCPVCLGEYPPQNRFCVRDGAPLNEGRSSGPFFQGMICPTCRRGYAPDARFCPEDADELVPYGLYGAANATRPPLRLDANKICPECGVRHAAAHLFCGHDGSELVVVN
jgi:hypothetical protein